MSARKDFFIFAGVMVIFFAILFTVAFELIQTRSQNAHLLSWQHNSAAPRAFFAAWGGVIFACVVLGVLIKGIVTMAFRRFKDPLNWQGGDDS